jgi:hypothetical protein
VNDWGTSADILARLQAANCAGHSVILAGTVLGLRGVGAGRLAKKSRSASCAQCKGTRGSQLEKWRRGPWAECKGPPRRGSGRPGNLKAADSREAIVMMAPRYAPGYRTRAVS